jgi:hypothetical protein
MSNHIHVPVGWDCNTARKVKREGNKHVSYPFDWTGQSYDSICLCLDNGYDNAFTNYHTGSLTYTSDAYPGKTFQAIFDYDLQFVGAHDYYVGVDFADMRLRYQKMYNRLLADLSVATEVTLHGSVPSADFKAYGIAYYQQRLNLDLSLYLTYDKTIDDVADRIAVLAPNATINKVEDTVTQMVK